MTVYVPVGLRKQLRVRAAREGVTISGLVEKCVRLGLAVPKELAATLEK